MKKQLTTKKAPMKILSSSMPSNHYKRFLVQCFSDREVEIIDFTKEGGNFDPEIELLLFTGGADVTPQMYGANKGKYTSTNPNRDELENIVFDMYRHLPKLGICRGSQFLTVKSGGKLIQHVEGHGGEHNIQTEEGVPAGHHITYPMSSTHHQMMYPFSINNKANYQLIAWSEFFKSNTYLNGNNNEMNLPDDFLEPEIVFYPKTNSLAIQGHPEYPQVDTRTVEFCNKLIKKYL